MSYQDLENGTHPPHTTPDRDDENRRALVSSIFQINTSVSSFRRLVHCLGTSKDTISLREKLHKTEQHIEKLVKEALAMLKTVSDTDHKSDLTKQITDRKLAKDFEAVLKDFQNLQRTAKRHWSNPPVGSGASVRTDASSVQEEEPFLLQEKRQEMIALETERLHNEAIIEEREQGIHEIQQQIGEVHEIFKDLAVLVHEQGIMIDDIDSNIGNAHAMTIQANKQLATASKSQRSTSSLACLLLIIFGVAVTIVMLLLVL